MNSILKISAFSLLIGTVLTLASYFFVTNKPDNCPNIQDIIKQGATGAAGELGDTPSYKARGFPYPYVEEDMTPVIDSGSFCSSQFLEAKHSIYYSHLGLDIIEWSVVGFLISFLLFRKRVA